jgi:hypothetical protein
MRVYPCPEKEPIMIAMIKMVLAEMKRMKERLPSVREQALSRAATDIVRVTHDKRNKHRRALAVCQHAAISISKTKTNS